MKKVLLAGTLLCHFLAGAQTSIQFSAPLPPESNTEGHIDPQYYGTYKSSTSGTAYRFDESGVWIISTIVAYVTKEQLRESSALDERNGYLFGIVTGDSIPCIFEDDRYYYGIENKQQVIGDAAGNRLTRIDGKTYLINFRENNYYEPSQLQFEGQTLRIVHGDLGYRPEFVKLVKVKTIDLYGSTVDIVTPSKAQWTALRAQLFTGDALNYLKVP